MDESPKDNTPETETAPPKAARKRRKKAAASRAKPKTRKLPPYNVILLDDNDHTYDYVIEMLARVFGHPENRAYKMAKEVDGSGRVIVMTTHKELAELKRDQILGFGADWRLERSAGSMSAIIEPAPE